MEKVKVEKAWEHSGFHCEVRIMPMGHRCGYVAVGKDHQFYGVNYDCLPVDFEPEVNGGITYSRQEGDLWVFGFDFAHCWDNQDPALVNGEYAQWRLKHQDECGRVGTLEIAVTDCERLADALYKRKDKEYVYTVDGYRFDDERIPDAIMCKGVRYEKMN